MNTEKNILVRLADFMELYMDIKKNKYQYPIKFYVVGFGYCRIKNEAEHLGRIHEMVELLGLIKEELYEKLNYNDITGNIEKLFGGIKNG